jgi:lysophospholipase L1-like esterase
MMARPRERMTRRRVPGGANAQRRQVPVWLAMTVTLGMIAGSAAGALIDRPLISPPGPVLLVGDSLFFQSADELQRALRGDGWNVSIVAYPGAGITGGGYTQQLEWAHKLRLEAKLVHPRVAVVELGTNGCGPGCTSIPDAIDEVIDSLDVDLVLWLTVRTDAARPRNAGDINTDLHDAAGTNVDLDVLPYDEWFTGRSELIRPDGVHLTPVGQRALAHRVRAALRDRAGIGG